MTYDMGFLHPDTEENAYLKWSRGDGSLVIPLMAEYLSSWAPLPRLVALSSDYHSYVEPLVTHTQFWTFDDQERLNEFLQRNSLDFTISPTISRPEQDR
jgi:hypothetical protein